jgi:putative DNA primase/helicase
MAEMAGEEQKSTATKPTNGRLPAQNKTTLKIISDEEFKRIKVALESNEVGDANLLVEELRDDYVFDHSANQWFRWAGHFWVIDDIGDVYKEINHVVSTYEKARYYCSYKESCAIKNRKKEQQAYWKHMLDQFRDRMFRLQSKQRIKNVLELASKGGSGLALSGKEWDQNVELIAFNNGVLELNQNGPLFRAGRPDDYIKTAISYDYDPQAQAPRFEQFMHEIFKGSSEIVKFTQRLFGYSISGTCREHIFPILWGPGGRNGKSTLIETLGYVLESYAGIIKVEALIEQKNASSANSANPDIYDLRGKRLVWGSETPRFSAFNISKVKLLTGGDRLKGRPLYGHDVEFQPQLTLFLVSNWKPKATPEDEAFWKRAFLIEFTQRFIRDAKQDQENEHLPDADLKDKLKAERQGIINWLVDGYYLYRKDGLNPPDEVLAATAEYRRREDVFGSFLHECCIVYPGDKKIKTPAQELQKKYDSWCEENGHKPAKSRLWKECCELHGIGKEKTRTGAFYIGVAMKADPEMLEAYGYE